VRLGIEGRRVPVGLGKRVGQRPAGHPVDFGEHVARRIWVHLCERANAHAVLHPEHLEQGELQIAEIALVVAHVLAPNSRGGPPATRR
jgi:hypothetical protein